MKVLLFFLISFFIYGSLLSPAAGETVRIGKYDHEVATFTHVDDHEFRIKPLNPVQAYRMAIEEAMLDLFESTSGKHWTNKVDWFKNVHPCQKKNVFICNDQSQVIKISLPKNNLRGTIPPSLFNISTLEEIVLPGNQLEGSIPSEIGKLKNLRTLWLGTNKLSGSLPTTLSECTNLRIVWLQENLFTGAIPDSWRHWSGIEQINLKLNHLSGSFPEFLTDLPNLKFLDISSNYFTGDLPHTTSNLIGRNIFLHDNAWEEVPYNIRSTPFHTASPFWPLNKHENEEANAESSVAESEDSFFAFRPIFRVTTPTAVIDEEIPKGSTLLLFVEDSERTSGTVISMKATSGRATMVVLNECNRDHLFSDHSLFSVHAQVSEFDFKYGVDAVRHCLPDQSCRGISWMHNPMSSSVACHTLVVRPSSQLDNNRSFHVVIRIGGTPQHRSAM